MEKFLSYIIRYSIGIAILAFGWGLNPQSWEWIISGGIVLSLLGALFSSGK